MEKESINVVGEVLPAATRRFGLINVVGSCRRQREDLAYPFEQRLFFAGEATHVHGHSTAHGAMTAAFAPRKKPSQP
jgi:hypothetical protein